MRKLREQMVDLRMELRTSLQLLKASIHVVHDGLQEERWRDTASPIPILEVESRTRRAFELLASDTRRRKVT
jgi:hypothetical protein